MSIDMSQFYQVFYEEVAEHLESMESLMPISSTVFFVPRIP
jgi:hypothetical protein